VLITTSFKYTVLVVLNTESRYVLSDLFFLFKFSPHFSLVPHHLILLLFFFLSLNFEYYCKVNENNNHV
jgi:hypothetical protein